MKSVLNQDLDNLIAYDAIDWDMLREKNVLVTGGTGLVGSLLIKTLLHYNMMRNGNIHVIAFVRDRQKAEKIFGVDAIERGLSYVVGDISQPIDLPETVHFIVHAASVTASKMMVTKSVETLFTTLDGTRNMLEIAKKKNICSMVYISSMEVYGVTDPGKTIITEDDLGFVDLRSPRSSYPGGKRCAELMCACYQSEYQVPVKIARLAQTFGAGVLESENRVFAQFAKSALRRENIVLHTAGRSTGNYCYTADAVAGILCILTRGANGEAYTVVNEATTMQIRDMAAMVAEKLADNEIQIIFDIPESNLTYGYAPDVTMRLSGEKLHQLGWKPSYDLPDMYQRMVADWILGDRK